MILMQAFCNTCSVFHTLPMDSLKVLFIMKDLSTHYKKIAAVKLHCQYCHPPFAFLKKVQYSMKTFLNILENIQIVVLYVTFLNQLYQTCSWQSF